MEPSIHPRHDTIAFVVSGPNADTDALGYRLRIADASGDRHRESDHADVRDPKWAADGSVLGVRVRHCGSWQLALIDEALTVQMLPELPGSVIGFDWSPDSDHLVAEIVPKRASMADTQIWIVNRATRQLWRIENLAPGSPSMPAWSPDGESLAFIHPDRTNDVDHNASAISIVSAFEDSLPRRVAGARGSVRSLCWSPDGATIGYLAQRTDGASWANNELWLVNGSGTEHLRLAEGLDRSIGQVVRGDDERGIGVPSLAWSRSGDSILACFADGGTSAIAAFDLTGGFKSVVAGPRAILEFDISATSGAIAFTWSDSTTPGDLSVSDSEGSEREITAFGEALRTKFEVAPTKRVAAEAEDGAVVEGWITLPRTDVSQPCALVLQVHGGPHYPVGERFSFDAQRLAAQGISLLRANPRGSQGYGTAFASAIRGRWGTLDFTDLMGLIDSALELHAIDPSRLAIVGESYGGFMTTWAIGHTDRFAAAVCENGVTDLRVASAANSEFWREEMGVDADDGRDLYAETSPVTHQDAIDTPLLLIHAEDDEISPVSQSETLFAALRERGAEVELMTIPSETHFVNVFGRPSMRIRKSKAIDAFLRDKLGLPPESSALRTERNNEKATT